MNVSMPHTPLCFGERRGEPIVVAYVNTELLRFDIDGRPIDSPITLPLVGGQVSAGAGLGLIHRPCRGVLVDLETGAVLEEIAPLRGGIVSPRGTRIALSRGKAFQWLGVSVRSPKDVGADGYPPPIPDDAEPLWVSDDLDDDREWHLLYAVGARIARYSYFEDESRVLVERRHGEHMLRVAADGSVIACEGSKSIHFVSGEDGRLLFESRRRVFAVGAGGRIALAEPRGVLRLVGPRGVETTKLDPWQLAFSLDGSYLAWSSAGAFGVLRDPC